MSFPFSRNSQPLPPLRRRPPLHRPPPLHRHRIPTNGRVAGITITVTGGTVILTIDTPVAGQAAPVAGQGPPAPRQVHATTKLVKTPCVTLCHNHAISEHTETARGDTTPLQTRPPTVGCAVIMLTSGMGMGIGAVPGVGIIVRGTTICQPRKDRNSMIIAHRSVDTAREVIAGYYRSVGAFACRD